MLVGFVMGVEMKQKNQILVNEATATIEECNMEIQVIHSELNRLKSEKSSLNDLLSYYDVIHLRCGS